MQEVDRLEAAAARAAVGRRLAEAARQLLSWREGNCPKAAAAAAMAVAEEAADFDARWDAVGAARGRVATHCDATASPYLVHLVYASA